MGIPSRRDPLVAEGPALSAEQAERAARQMRLPGFGASAQRRLRAARVLVIGAGGLGSACVPYLAGAGIGTIGIVDDDVVDLSNLHRQVAHRTEDLGRMKTTSLADAARRVDPSVVIREHPVRLTSETAPEIFASYDLVIDGSDNFPTRYLANDAAELAGIPLIWGSILAHHGQVSVAWHAHGPGYRDLFPQPPAPESVVTCATGGVLPGLCGTIGTLLATEAMKLIVGAGEPLIGRVLIYDALSARTRELSYERDPLAKPVRELIDYEAFCAGPGAPPAVSAAELVRRIGQIRLVDVREPDEYERISIPGAELRPIGSLESDLGAASAGGSRAAGFVPGERVTVYCASGPRSIRGAALLRASGVDADYLSGGIEQFARVAPQVVRRGRDEEAAG